MLFALGIHWASWVCGFIIFTEFGSFCLLFLQIFSPSHFLFTSGTPIIHILACFKLFFWGFFVFFSLCFILDSSYCYVWKVIFFSSAVSNLLLILPDIFLFEIYIFNIFYWLCCYSCPNSFPFASLYPVLLFPPSIPTPPLSSCPWVMHVSSLAFPFPILFLTSPCLFCTYRLCLLIPTPFLPFSTFRLPADNPPNDPHTYDSVPVSLFA